MHEFEFVVRFDPGADRLMDVFQRHRSLTTRSSVCHTTDRTMWRVDHVKGASDALDAFDAVFLDETRCNECLAAPECDTHRQYHVLDRTANSRTVYTIREEVHRCHSVPHHVYGHVGDGVIFESRRQGGEYRWRVLYPEDRPVGELYDAIGAQLREGLSLDLVHLSRAGNWDAESRVAAELSPEHWRTLEVAVERGYFERPRQVTVADLSDVLDAPRTTVQYRLRTAEDRIVRHVVENAL